MAPEAGVSQNESRQQRGQQHGGVDLSNRKLHRQPQNHELICPLCGHRCGEELSAPDGQDPTRWKSFTHKVFTEQLAKEMLEFCKSSAATSTTHFLPRGGDKGHEVLQKMV